MLAKEGFITEIEASEAIVEAILHMNASEIATEASVCLEK